MALLSQYHHQTRSNSRSSRSSRSLQLLLVLPFLLLLLHLSSLVVAVDYELLPGGPCRGPGGPNDKINGMNIVEHTQDMCESACTERNLINNGGDTTRHCLGYSYCDICNGGECVLYGPGLDGSCSDGTVDNRPACEALGSCDAPSTATKESECGTCAGKPTALERSACESIDGVWNPSTWTSAGAVWDGAEDPFTGESHPSKLITGTTEEVSSAYVCYDHIVDDHLAHCTGTTDDDGCASMFEGLTSDDRIADNCPSPCVFVPAPTGPKNPPVPHAPDIKLPGWDPAMSGACRGGTDSSLKPNGKYSNTGGADGGPLTQLECATACLEEPTCLGYAHGVAWCIVYGPGIHKGVDTGDDGVWTSDQHEATDITGTKVNIAYICVTGPPHTLGMEGSIIGGGIELFTDVQRQLDHDQILEILTHAMGDESCEGLEAGQKLYNDAPYYTSIPHYTGSKGVELTLYEDYYGPEFLEKWMDAAFNNNKAEFKNSAADFSNLPGDTDGSGDCVGREEAVKKGIAYTSTYIDLNQYFVEAIDQIQDGCIWGEDVYTDGQLNSNPCTNAVHAWEKAIATWSGSMEGHHGRNLREPGKTGKWLQALAEKRCVNFKTCGVDKDDSTSKGVTPRSNMNIVAAFTKGREAVYYGQLGVVRRTISEINKELTVSRIQGVLRYAYRLGKNKSKKDKEIAEGGAFAFGLLPQIYACNKKSALVLAANTDIGGENTSQQNGKSANFANVRAALECNYKCLGIRFSDVGELNDCVDSNDEKTLCFKKRADKGNICNIKSSDKFKKKCAKIAPSSNNNKDFANTRFGTVGKKQFT